MTRFVNHHCNSNAKAIEAMYGKRAVIAFKTNRDIAAGEEISIDYGPDYFDRRFPCGCDAFDYPHTSETYRRRVFPDGSVSLQGFRSYGPQCNQPLFSVMRKSVTRGPIPRTPEAEELEPEAGSARAEVAAPKVKRRRMCRGPISDEGGGDLDGCSLRRSGRIGDNTNVDDGWIVSTPQFYATKTPVKWGLRRSGIAGNSIDSTERPFPTRRYFLRPRAQ